jgi:hypothetical protein
LIVIAGLDPAIHAAAKLDQTFRSEFASRKSAWTTGIKSGGDEDESWLFDIENQNACVHTRCGAAIRCRASCRDRAKLVANG